MSAKTNEEQRNKEEQVAKNRAHLLRVNYVDTRSDDVDFMPEIIKPETMLKLKLVPLRTHATQLMLGFTLDTPQASLEAIKKQLPEYNVAFAFISQSGWQSIYDKYYQYAHKDEPKPPGPEEVAEQLANKILDMNKQITDTSELNLFDNEFSQAQQSELFKFLVQQAYLLNSSDIHIEPEPKGARVRFRIDGRLHVVGHLEQRRYEVLLNSLQMKARIRWNADYPQTGSTKETLINHQKEQVEVNMRIETVPTLHGSDVVIRIFNMEEAYLSLENLGLSPYHSKKIEKLISQPHGLVLMVGPTGSGKSSTQYAILNKLNTPEVKIVTLEDPVEYEINGITQIPVNTDDAETFMDKLRAVMREDPDIIMIGEIRDAETARTALQASLTGHLVLSTFHAASSAAAVTRMLDMIDYNPLLASAFRLVMSQRLVRKLCEHCKEQYKPQEDVAQIIARALQGLSEQPEEILLYKPVGCDKCHNIGYQGRLIVLEQLEITDSIASEITANQDISVNHLHDLAVSNGMITMLQDGIQKALRGETSIEEILRTVDLR